MEEAAAAQLAVFSSPAAHRHSVLPAKCTGCRDKNFSKTKTAPTLGGGIAYVETREGENRREGDVGWKPRCSSIRRGFLPRENLLQLATVSTSPHHIIHL